MKCLGFKQALNCSFFMLFAILNQNLAGRLLCGLEWTFFMKVFFLLFHWYWKSNFHYFLAGGVFIPVMFFINISCTSIDHAASSLCCVLSTRAPISSFFASQGGDAVCLGGWGVLFAVQCAVRRKLWQNLRTTRTSHKYRTTWYLL